MKPYTYLIKHLLTGQFYYGSQYGKNSDPDKFWKPGGYFTSSKKVKELISYYGEDSFIVQVRVVFKTALKAIKCEQRVIRKIIQLPGCINARIPGPWDLYAHNYRKVIVGSESSYSLAGKKLGLYWSLVDPETGLTLGQLRGLKIKGIKRSEATIAKIKEYHNQPEIKKQKSERMIGDQNIVHKPGVRETISSSMLKYYQTPEYQLEKTLRQEKIQQTKVARGSYKKHSEWMKQFNPASNTRWINNGLLNHRHPVDLEIPEGFQLGRIKVKVVRKASTCPHCGFTGKGPNMKRYHFDKCKKK